MLYVVDLGEYSSMFRSDGPARLQAVGSDDLVSLEKIIRRALLGAPKTLIGKMKVAPIQGTGKVSRVQG